MTQSSSDAWDAEYRNQGIPSSYRDDVSSVVVWAVANARMIMSEASSDTSHSAPALDVGCGTGRNAIYLASQGFEVTAFDSSREALRIASARPSAGAVAFSQRNLEDGLPGRDRAYRLITDVFVYKHQVDDNVRARYRAELRRALRDDGVVLISLAAIDDGYYAACPQMGAARVDMPGTMRVTDPAASDVPSILFTAEALESEMSSHFDLAMLWIKDREGQMHGQIYRRRTFATLWTPRS